jgi:prevent-host-death family protein
MQQVNSTDFKSHFGEYADLVRDEPIEVLRGSKPVGVFISPDEYEHLQRLEDAYWTARGQASEAIGEWVGPEEAMRLLTNGLKRAE